MSSGGSRKLWDFSSIWHIFIAAPLSNLHHSLHNSLAIFVPKVLSCVEWGFVLLQPVLDNICSTVKWASLFGIFIISLSPPLSLSLSLSLSLFLSLSPSLFLSFSLFPSLWLSLFISLSSLYNLVLS